MEKYRYGNSLAAYSTSRTVLRAAEGAVPLADSPVELKQEVQASREEKHLPITQEQTAARFYFHNMGCPVKKVVTRGASAALLRDTVKPGKMEAIHLAPILEH